MLMLVVFPLVIPAPCAQDPIFSSEVSARGRREHLVKVNQWGRYIVEANSAEGVSVEVVDKLRGAFARGGQVWPDDRLDGFLVQSIERANARVETNARIEVFLDVGYYKIFTEGPDDANGQLYLTVSRFAEAVSADSLAADSSVVVSTGFGSDKKHISTEKYEYLDPFKQTAAELRAGGAKAWWIFVPQDTLVYIEAQGRRFGGLAVFRSGEWLVAEAGERVLREADSISGARVITEKDRNAFINTAIPEKPLNGLHIYQRLERGKHLVVAYGSGKDRYTVEDDASPLYVQWMLPVITHNRQVVAEVNPSGFSFYAVSTDDFIVESLDRERLILQTSMLTPERIRPSRSYDTTNTRTAGAVIPTVTIRHRASGAGQRMLLISGKPGSRFRISPLANTVSGNFTSFSPPEDGAYQLTTLHTGYGGDNLGASGVLVDMRDSSIVALRADTLSVHRPVRRQFNATVTGWQTSYLWVNEARTYTFTPGGDAVYNWRIMPFFVSEPRDYVRPDLARGTKAVTLNRGLHVIMISPASLGKASLTVTVKTTAQDNVFDRRDTAGVEIAAPSPSVVFRPLKLQKGRTYRFYPNTCSPERVSAHFEKYPPVDENIAGIYIKDEIADREELRTSRVSELVFDVPQYVDIRSGQIKTYQFTVTEPGIYKIETTGRLHTKLTARDRFNGLRYVRLGDSVSRNAMIAEYFLPGSYLLVAETVGKSAGRMGIVLTKGNLLADGRLENGIDRRVSLKADEAVVYDLVVDRRERYRFFSSLQWADSHHPRVRLEDADGWSLFKYGDNLCHGDAYTRPCEVELDRGAYRFYSLPLWFENYRSTLAQVVERPTEFSGRDTSKTLFAGINRNVDTLRTMRVRVDEAGVYEIFSKGRKNISGRLYGADGKTEVARGGGSQQDWNFIISEHLDSGTYLLRLTTVKIFDEERLSLYLPSKVFMRRVEDTLMQTIKIGNDGMNNSSSTNNTSVGAATCRLPLCAEIQIPLTGKQAVIPIEPSSGDVLIIKTSASSRLITTLESSPNNTVISRHQGKKTKISVPFAPNTKFTLKIRSEDRGNSSVDLVIKTVESIPLTYEKALSGVTGTAYKHQYQTGYYRIDDMPVPPAHYELIPAPLIVSSALGRQPLENAILNTSGVNSAGTAFGDDEGLLIANSGRQLWIKAAFKAADRYRFVLSPVLITDVKEIAERNRRKFETADRYRFSRTQVKYPERAELPVVLRPNQEKIFEVDTPVQKFGIVEFSMISGQPLAGLSTSSPRADFTRGGIPVLGGQYVDERFCLTAVVPGDTGRIVGWNAESAGFGSDGISGSFTMRNFSLGKKADTLNVGRTAWTAKPLSAKEYYINPGSGRTAIVKLSPRTGFLYVSMDGDRNMYYGGDEGAEHLIQPYGGKLFLFGALSGSEAGNIELEVYASAPSPWYDVLTAATGIDRQLSAGSREVIKIKKSADDPGRLFFSGAIDNVDLISREGQITRNIKSGAALAGSDGILLVNYAPGSSRIRLCADDGSILGLNECRWGDVVRNWEDAPVVGEMSKLVMADGVNWYSIELAEPAHVSLSASAPVAAIIAVDGRVRDYEEFWDGFSWDIPFAPGRFTIGVKPLAGATLAGSELSVGFYPILLLTEDKPLELHLMSGQKRMARFDLPRKNRVGLGLSAERGTAEALLLDGWGRSVGGGRQIFSELDKGAYHVLLSNPSTSAGAGVKLHLFGQNSPPADPPRKLLKWIVGGGVGERP